MVSSITIQICTGLILYDYKHVATNSKQSYSVFDNSSMACPVSLIINALILRLNCDVKISQVPH